MKKQTIKTNARKTMIACGILAASLSLSASAFAFSDLSGVPAADKINALQSSGVISGVNNDKFAPKSKVTFAQGIQFLVNAFDLTLDSQSTGSSKASHYFDKVPDTAWYAEAFLIAQQNGLSVDKTVNPNGVITRAQFAHLLHQALLTKGDFVTTKMYFHITDGQKLPQGITNSLQTLLNTRIISLNEDDTFRPNDAITRSEAAVWIYDAAEFAKKINPTQEEQTPEKSYEAIVKVEKATADVNKVSLTVDNLPNSGYSASIERIEFNKDKTATVYFTVNSGDPDQMYLQVISKSTVVTYISADYKPVAKYSATTSNPFSLMLPTGEAPATPIDNVEELIAK
ncbi:S-layer homology domain-containing protein [Paenibacillus sp. IHBB 10380]|uniref:S-layer homology domain-containing protein n=1 Tax=Paenibacillus sp. IHBB 10380 TaxID=1566358 RepID=UPI0005CFA06F|nr:S-layer homology domain-containing protein [Paenibacillus sp. IHBB 10380]AJS61148.1 hypothetical protein UB51_24970 [Paenibacillus sp. IHBB 10380]